MFSKVAPYGEGHCHRCHERRPAVHRRRRPIQQSQAQARSSITGGRGANLRAPVKMNDPAPISTCLQCGLSTKSPPLCGGVRDSYCEFATASPCLLGPGLDFPIQRGLRVRSQRRRHVSPRLYDFWHPFCYVWLGVMNELLPAQHLVLHWVQLESEP
ncbi:hypothetical protein GY45DRAFT_183791 [Cubamyces sp. BRFM 1775]|nr:hypothetical protein GY45DRAFT_183791 [Cubamyces sp. BRFM 1775]